MDQLPNIKDAARDLFFSLNQMFTTHTRPMLSAQIPLIPLPARNQIRRHFRTPYKKLLSSTAPYSGVLLPRNTKFVFRHGDTTIFVIEERPQIRQVVFHYDMINSCYYDVQQRFTGVRKRVFKLALPYVIFVVAINDRNIELGCFPALYSFFSNKPLDSLDAILYQNCLPNIDKNDLVCLPPPKFRQYQKAKSYAQVAELAIVAYWSSTFTDDTPEFAAFEAMVGDSRPLKSLWDWERRSEQDVDFILKIPWRKTNCEARLLEMIRNFLDTDDDLRTQRIVDYVLSRCHDTRNQVISAVRTQWLSTKLPVDFENYLQEQLAKYLRGFREALLTVIANGDKTIGQKKLAAMTLSVERFFDDLIGTAPTTKGGGA